jgi:hypothetical protein
MKKLFLAALFLGAMAFKPAHAQISVSLNLNIGNQPDWGPTGYDHVDYYYMPDIDCYYDVPNRQYIYLNGNSWTRATALPPRYANYDIYHGYKVVVNQPQPYLHAATYRAKYARYKGVRTQTVIRDSRDVKYTRYKNTRPQFNRPQPQQQARPDRGRPQNNDRGNDNRGNNNRGNNDRGNDKHGHGDK